MYQPYMKEIMPDFEISVDALKSLMNFRKRDGQIMINIQYGGIEELCKLLNTDPQKGIINDSTEIEGKRKEYGVNEFLLPQQQLNGFFDRIFHTLKNNPSLIALFVSPVVCLLLLLHRPQQNNGEIEAFKSCWIEGGAICITVTILTLSKTLMNYIKEKTLTINVKAEQYATVIRNGIELQIAFKEIVVGDIVELSCGDIIPADGIVINSSSLSIEESLITSENKFVEKSSNGDPMLFSGTYVVEGHGRMLIVAVGKNTQNHIPLSLVNDNDDDEENETSDNVEDSDNSSISDSKDLEETSKPPQINHVSKPEELQEKLNDLEKGTKITAAYTGITTMLIVLLKFCVANYVGHRDDSNNIVYGRGFQTSDVQFFVYYIISAICFTIMTNMNGLQIIYTLKNYFTIKTLKNTGCVVQNFKAFLKLSNVTRICVDKNTLIENHLNVVQSFLAEEYYGNGKIFDFTAFPKNLMQLIGEAITVTSNDTGFLSNSEKPQKLNNEINSALIEFVSNFGDSYFGAGKNIIPSNLIVKSYDMNPSGKATIVQKSNNSGYRIFIRDTATNLLSRCKWIVGIDFKIKPAETNALQEVINSMEANGLEVVCIAYKDYCPVFEHQTNNMFQQEFNCGNQDDILSDFTILFIAGLQAPLKSDVLKHVQKCRDAGITITMFTNDPLNSACSTAISAGILGFDSENAILEGKEFNEKIFDENGNFNQLKFDVIMPDLKILANASSEDKYNLIKGISESNSKGSHVVAVTGTDAKDCRTLKKADIGFACGRTGTAVTKDVADIILTGDNFVFLVNAIVYSKQFHVSIAQYLQLQIVQKFVVGIIFIFVALSTDKIIPNPMQMLWICIALDITTAFALSFETSTENFLSPNNSLSKTTILPIHRCKSIIAQTAYQVIILGIITYMGDKIFGISSALFEPIHSGPFQHFTIIFNAFVLMNLFNLLNARKVYENSSIFKGISKNPLFCIIWIATLTCQFFIVEYGGYWFSTASLSIQQWLACFCFGIGCLLLEHILKYIPSTIFWEFL